MIYDHEAIRKAYPNVKSIIDNVGVFDKDKKEVTLDQAKVDAARIELNKLNYKIDRAVAYDPITEQLDQLYWDKKNGTNKWVEAIDKVKADNPKP